MTPVVSVVVPTFNRAEVLERCLRALLAQEAGTPELEIIVVDDCSRDDTADRVCRLADADPRVRLIRHETNRGRSAARNTGIRAARGELVLLNDDDILVSPGYVAAHVRRHRAGGGPLVVVGNLGFPADVVAASNHAKYLQSRYLGHRRPGERDGIDPDDLHPRFLGSGISSAPRESLLAAGLFDEAARYYGCEDHLYAVRLRAAGLRIVFAPDAVAEHLDSVAIAWYKAKMLETAREGIPLLLEHCPGFVEETALRTLLPVDWKRDGLQRIARKLAVRAALNPLSVWLLERWAVATDRYERLYSHTVYRALAAGWMLRGLRMRRGDRELVVYGR